MPVYHMTEMMGVDPEIEGSPNRITSIRFASPLHNHDFYEFFLITKGSCNHLVNREVQKLADGALVFIRPEDTHAYEYDGSGDCEFVNIPFTAGVMSEALELLGGKEYWEPYLKLPLPPVVLLSRMEREALLSDYEKLSVLSTVDKRCARLFLRGMIVNTLTHYFLTGHDAGAGSLPEWLGATLADMQKKENFAPGLTRMYELSGRSPAQLNRAFRHYLSTTPVAYINSLRLAYAKTLLLTTEQSVVDIAYETGFNNLSHFYHLFRAEYGLPPAGLRKNRELNG